MKKKMAIIGTDNRLDYLQEALASNVEVELFSTMTWDVALEVKIARFEPQIIFFPIQAMNMQKSFFFPKTCEIIFVGKKYQELEQVYKQSDLKVFCYLEDEQWIWDNANLTAEGFINYFYLHEKQSLYDKQFIITGYGRVGKRLAFALHHLGAKVIVSVRSEHQLFEAKSYGFQIKALENVVKEQTDESIYLVNTIPSKWLKNEETTEFKKIFDLASKPGCLLDADDEVPSNYVNPTSLPGMYFPQDAGYLLASSVKNQLALLEEEK